MRKVMIAEQQREVYQLDLLGGRIRLYINLDKKGGWVGTPEPTDRSDERLSSAAFMALCHYISGCSEVLTSQYEEGLKMFVEAEEGEGFDDDSGGSSGPAINCPGHTAETDCEDYPGGACDACNEAEDAANKRKR